MSVPDNVFPPLSSVGMGHAIGPDWVTTPTGPFQIPNEQEWALGELGRPLSAGSGSGSGGLLYPLRYSWQELVPLSDGTLVLLATPRGSPDGDYVIPLNGQLPVDPTGMRVLLRKTAPGYWIAVGMAQGALVGSGSYTDPATFLDCLAVDTAWYSGYVRAYGSYGPTLFGAGSGSCDVPMWLGAFTRPPRTKARSVLFDPNQIFDQSPLCQSHVTSSTLRAVCHGGIIACGYGDCALPPTVTLTGFVYGWDSSYFGWPPSATIEPGEHTGPLIAEVTITLTFDGIAGWIGSFDFSQVCPEGGRRVEFGLSCAGAALDYSCDPLNPTITAYRFRLVAFVNGYSLTGFGNVEASGFQVYSCDPVVAGPFGGPSGSISETQSSPIILYHPAEFNPCTGGAIFPLGDPNPDCCHSLEMYLSE